MILLGLGEGLQLPIVYGLVVVAHDAFIMCMPPSRQVVGTSPRYVSVVVKLFQTSPVVQHMLWHMPTGEPVYPPFLGRSARRDL